MLDDVAVAADESGGELEVLIPSQNFAGVARKKIALTPRPFAGARILLYGDSITNEFGMPAGTYTDRIKAKFHTDDVHAFGHNGYRIGSLEAGRTESLTNDVLIGDVARYEPEILIVMGGTNDYWHGIELGERFGSVEDMAYVNTTSGGLHYLLYHLIKNLPTGTKIMFCTPPPGYYDGKMDTELNTAGYRMMDYVGRIREICQEYHVPVCDVWSHAGWSTFKEGVEFRYTTDGVHLSEEGYERLTTLQAAEAERFLA